MSSIIDSLVAELDLDISKFTDKQRKALDELRRTADQMRAPAKAIEDGFAGLSEQIGAVQTRLLGIASIFLGGMGVSEFTRHVVELTNSLSRLGLVTGTTVGSLTMWGNMGALVGASRAGVQAGVSGLSNSINGMFVNPSENSAMIQTMGAMRNLRTGQGMMGAPNSYVKSDGTPDVDKFLSDMNAWATQPGMSRGRASAVLQHIPGMNQDLLSVVLQDREKFLKMQQEVQKYAPTQSQVDSVNKLVEAWGKMSSSADKLGQVLLENVEPVLEKIIDTATKLFDWAQTPETREQQFIERQNNMKRGGFMDWWNGKSDIWGDPIKKTTPVPSSSQTGTTTAAPSGRVSSNAAASTIASRLRANGFSDDAVAAIMGNVQQESGFKSSSNKLTWDVHQYSSGYFQFGPGQRAEYMAWLNANHPGANSSDPGLQADFVAYQLKTRPEYRRTYDALNNPNLSLAQKTYEFQGGAGFGYERPASYAANTPARVAYAQRWAAALKASDTQWGNGFDAVPFANLRPGALAAAGGVTNSSTSSTTVNSMNIYTQTGDPYNLGIGIKRALENTSDVAAATTGPL